jgi:uncharacterized protein YggU (UPF0235/DUF167 family)
LKIKSFQRDSRSNDKIHLHVVVKPNARTTDLYFDGEFLRADLLNPPEKGKANLELIKLLANRLKISPNQIELIAGHSSRDKYLLITGITLNDEDILRVLTKNR